MDQSITNMNERSQVVLVLALTALCSVHGYSSNTIKDYQNNKEYLLSASSVVNKFEDNEIRGESSIYSAASQINATADTNEKKMSWGNNLASLSETIQNFTVGLRETQRWNLFRAVFI